MHHSHREHGEHREGPESTEVDVRSDLSSSGAELPADSSLSFRLPPRSLAAALSLGRMMLWIGLTPEAGGFARLDHGLATPWSREREEKPGVVDTSAHAPHRPKRKRRPRRKLRHPLRLRFRLVAAPRHKGTNVPATFTAWPREGSGRPCVDV